MSILIYCFSFVQFYQHPITKLPVHTLGALTTNLGKSHLHRNFQRHGARCQSITLHLHSIVMEPVAVAKVWRKWAREAHINYSKFTCWKCQCQELPTDMELWRPSGTHMDAWHKNKVPFKSTIMKFT